MGCRNILLNGYVQRGYLKGTVLWRAEVGALGDCPVGLPLLAVHEAGAVDLLRHSAEQNVAHHVGEVVGEAPSGKTPRRRSARAIA